MLVYHAQLIGPGGALYNEWLLSRIAALDDVRARVALIGSLAPRALSPHDYAALEREQSIDLSCTGDEMRWFIRVTPYDLDSGCVEMS